MHILSRLLTASNNRVYWILEMPASSRVQLVLPLYICMDGQERLNFNQLSFIESFLDNTHHILSIIFCLLQICGAFPSLSQINKPTLHNFA